MSPESRAEYMKKRRETIGQFSVSISREKLDALTEKLRQQNKTKTQNFCCAANTPLALQIFSAMPLTSIGSDVII